MTELEKTLPRVEAALRDGRARTYDQVLSDLGFKRAEPVVARCLWYLERRRELVVDGHGARRTYRLRKNGERP